MQVSMFILDLELTSLVVEYPSDEELDEDERGGRAAAAATGVAAAVAA